MNATTPATHTDPLGLIGKMPIMVSLSGGKDSTAACLWLREQGLKFDAVFMDTGWEHPSTYQYIREELEPRFGPITWLRAEKHGQPEGMVDIIRRKGMFPSRLRRYCTTELKVYPASRHITERYQGCVINVLGIRAGESAARAKLDEWEAFPPIGAAAVWRPLIAWSEQDVIDMLLRHGVPPNPLYLQGASRVGCFPCIFSRKSEIRFVADTWPERIDEIRALEDEVTDAARARTAAKEGADLTCAECGGAGTVRARTALKARKVRYVHFTCILMTPERIERVLRRYVKKGQTGGTVRADKSGVEPCAPCHGTGVREQQRRAFFAGVGPKAMGGGMGMMPIDDVVQWSKTTRGGRQYDLLGPREDEGCMRWGLCDTAGDD